ncbi:AAA family ATPase [Bulleidia sp. HCP3S3_F2]|uniref:AAA family ATPase n=1 Tax=unclassified Bulleidia TaxID=2704656 RepID=UPI003F8C1375
MEDLMQFLREEGISEDVLHEVHEYVVSHPVSDAMKQRIPVPHFMYYGVNVWGDALCALLCGKNILLVGEKATGKNVLCENLAYVFQRPSWDISFHVNMDAASLIGTDSFENGKVVFREGPVYRCALNGGFGILDEINMAKNEALAVLHSVLDFRRVIDVPGYDRIVLKDETRFIATMNYNYAGTRELNEALSSRFVVIQMPPITQEDLQRLLKKQFPDMLDKYVKQFALLFLDFQKKCENTELSTKALDLRGMLDAIDLMHKGLSVKEALDLGITNKTFDIYEKQLIHDVINARISSKRLPSEIFQ